MSTVCPTSFRVFTMTSLSSGEVLAKTEQKGSTCRRAEGPRPARSVTTFPGTHRE